MLSFCLARFSLMIFSFSQWVAINKALSRILSPGSEDYHQQVAGRRTHKDFYATDITGMLICFQGLSAFSLEVPM